MNFENKIKILLAMEEITAKFNQLMAESYY